MLKNKKRKNFCGFFNSFFCFVYLYINPYILAIIFFIFLKYFCFQVFYFFPPNSLNYFYLSLHFIT